MTQTDGLSPTKMYFFTVLEDGEFKIKVPINPRSEGPFLFEYHVLAVLRVEKGVQGLSGASFIQGQIPSLRALVSVLSY